MTTITTPPVALTPGATVQLVPPQAPTQVSELILSNLSTFLLAVTAGADVRYLAPFTEDVYDVTAISGPISVNAIQLPGDTQMSGSIAPTWSDTPAAGNWPVTLSPAQIPGRLQVQQIFHGPIAPNPTTTAVEVGGYASLAIQISNTDGTSPTGLFYRFVDSTTGSVIDTGLLTADNLNGAQQPSWGLPVVADTFVMVALSGAPIVQVLGSNNDIGQRLLFGSTHPGRSFQAQIPANTPAGTRTQLLAVEANMAGLLVPPCSSYNGQVTYVSSVNTGTPLGNYLYGWRDGAGAREFTPSAIPSNPTSALVITTGGHPFGFVTWWWLNTTQLATAYVVNLNIIPAEVS